LSDALAIGIAAAGGLALGHAADLLFDRLYTDGPLAGPVHRCDECKAGVRPVFLLPLLGALWQRGRCPDCGRWLPLRAFLLAPGCAALAAAAQPALGEFGPGLLAGAFACVFLALAFTDLESRLIPNRVVYPSIAAAAALFWAWPDLSAAEVFGGGAAALAMTLLMFLAGRGAFGFGDVKMSLLMGLVVGFPAVLVGVFVGVFAAGAWVVPLMLAGVLGRRDYIAYGPFIAIGAVVALFWGEAIWDWYRPG
jgi:leader peptidase (prepilin peptidase)/N-methyltransferase